MKLSLIYKRIHKRAIDNIALLSLHRPTVRQREDNQLFRKSFQSITLDDFSFYIDIIIDSFGESVEKAMNDGIEYIPIPNIGSFRYNHIYKEILDYKKSHVGCIERSEIKDIISKQVDKLKDDKQIEDTIFKADILSILNGQEKENLN